MGTIASLRDWKNRLWPELFGDDRGDRGPVTILHIDDALFARAAGHSLGETTGRQSFLTAFPDRLTVQRWLTGAADPGEALLPVLILCCLAASEANDSEENDFRRRMRDLMGWNDVIVNCEGLPRLWSRLEHQSRVRAEATGSRPLVLPNPRHRTQIGHAVELTFPSRNDARRLHSLLERVNFDLTSPPEVLSWLEPHVAAGRFSSTFESTFASFRSAWLKAERALADHRFWSGWRVATADLVDREEAGFEIIADEWGTRYLVRPGTTDCLDLDRSTNARELPSSLIVAARQTHAIALVEGTWGRLRWAGRHPVKAPSAFLIRQRAFASRYTELHCVPVVGADGWGLTYAAGAIGRDNDTPRDRDRLLDLRPIGCHRVDGAILARPAFPFFLEMTGAVAEVALEGELADRFALERIDRHHWKMTASAPLVGEVTVIVTPTDGDLTLRRRLRFTRSVLVPAFRAALPERLFERNTAPSAEWPCDLDAPITAPSAELKVEGGNQSALSDLIEVLARRTAPLPMSDIHALARQAAGSSAPSPWDIIRALGDAGALRILETRGWRGRFVLSIAPRGAVVKGSRDYCLLFEGLLGESFIARLDAACAALALRRETLPGLAAWSPQTELIHSSAIEPLRELAVVLDVPIGFVRSTPSPLDAVRMGTPLAPGSARGAHYPVTLSGRHSPLFHVDADRPDLPPLWVVRDGAHETVWRDREDAVLQAYERAGERPFTVSTGRLVSHDARLPRHVARWIRLVTGRTSGPCADGYAYAWNGRVERAMPALVPLLLGDVGTTNDGGWRHSRRWPAMAITTDAGFAIETTWRRAREGIG